MLPTSGRGASSPPSAQRASDKNTDAHADTFQAHDATRIGIYGNTHTSVSHPPPGCGTQLSRPGNAADNKNRAFSQRLDGCYLRNQQAAGEG